MTTAVEEVPRANKQTRGQRPAGPGGDGEQRPAIPGDSPSPGKVTTVKAYKRFQRKVTQLAALLDINQQDVLNRYEQHLDEDLLSELAKRQKEIRHPTDEE